jgi:hypothetical protein
MVSTIFFSNPSCESRTKLRHGEKLSGLLVGPLSGQLSAVEAGFKAMNAALKQQVEQDATQKNAPTTGGVTADA